MSSLLPRPRCRCCGSHGAVAHWNWCKLPEAEREMYCSAVVAVQEREKEYREAVEPVAWRCD